MAYDILLRRQISSSWARGDEPRPPRLPIQGILCLVATGGALLHDQLQHYKENAVIRRELDDDSTITRRLPAIEL
jgi:hypothetical protein